MRVAENEAINNNQSLLIDEQQIQLDELQTTEPAVALKVRYSGSQALYPGTRIMYDTVVVDVANSFNLATGSFNAPRAGVYMFSVYTCVYPHYWGVLPFADPESFAREGPPLTTNLFGGLGERGSKHH